ncbi:YcfL family protein [Photobacterium phosphoreum]|uniref:YcfL family protein n=1 Tax=Photobacterium phosphoreum TaxID=659 RepID=UPI0039AEBBDF
MKYISALSILLVALVTGCSGMTISGISLEKGNHHVVIGNTVLASQLEFSHSQAELRNGYLDASVEVMNKTDAAISLDYHFYWYDVNGLEINQPTTTWHTLTINPGQVLLLQALAPSTAATQYRIAVRDANNCSIINR